MTQFRIASFNVKNLIGPDKEYYRFQSYTPEEYAWKEDWLADQLVAMNADVIGFQEIFEEQALRDTIARADRYGAASNDEAMPTEDKRYRKRAIFQHLEYRDYGQAALAEECADRQRRDLDGSPGQEVAVVGKWRKQSDAAAAVSHGVQ